MEVTRKQCDVFKSFKNVRMTRVKIEVEGDDGQWEEDMSLTIKGGDLSDRARERLAKFIERRLTPPTRSANNGTA